VVKLSTKILYCSTVSYIKRKSAIKAYREIMSHKSQFTGMHFWASRSHVSAMGLDEAEIREYVQCPKNLELE